MSTSQYFDQVLPLNAINNAFHLNRLDVSKVLLGDSTLSVLEIWGG